MDLRIVPFNQKMLETTNECFTPREQAFMVGPVLKGAPETKTEVPDFCYEAEKGSFKRFCFTSFWMEEPPFFDETKHNYLIFGREMCPRTYREHWQGYVEFKRPRGVRTVTATLNRTKDCEHHRHSRVFVSRGTAADNEKYCSKDGIFQSFGKPGGNQGKRTDLKSAYELNNMEELCQYYPETFVRYGRGFKEYYQTKNTLGKRPRPFIAVFFGSTGSGKSRLAADIAGDDSDPDAFWLMPKESDSRVWWDGYRGQDRVVIDELDPSVWDLRYLLRLLDRYPLRVQNKFGSIPFVSPLIIITTKRHPSQWYPNDKATTDLLRRLEEHGYIEDMDNIRLSDDERRRVECWGPVAKPLENKKEEVKNDFMSMEDIEKLLDEL